MRIKNSVKTKEIDKGYEEFMKAVNEMAEGPVIKIGILSKNNETVEGAEINLAQLAAVHEFGTVIVTNNASWEIPERSFIRSTMDENRQYLVQVTRNAIMNIALGADIDVELNKIGLLIASLIKKKITDLRDPPNAPSTIARKGSSNPLIDTGRMRASVAHEVIYGGAA